MTTIATTGAHANGIDLRIVPRMKDPERADQEIARARRMNQSASLKKSKMWKKARQVAKKGHHLLSRYDADLDLPHQSVLIDMFLAAVFIAARRTRRETESAEEGNHLSLRSQNENDCPSDQAEDTRVGKALPLHPLEIERMTAKVDEIEIVTEMIATKTAIEIGSEKENARGRGIVTDAVAVPEEGTIATEEMNGEVIIGTIEESEIAIETERRTESVNVSGRETDLENGTEIETETLETESATETKTEGPVRKDETGQEMREKEIGIETEILIDIDRNASRVSEHISRLPDIDVGLQSSIFAVYQHTIRFLSHRTSNLHSSLTTGKANLFQLSHEPNNVHTSQSVHPSHHQYLSQRCSH